MTTQRLVTMEFVPGIKINDIEKIEQAGIDRKLLAKRSAESYLTQICRYGFFRKLSFETSQSLQLQQQQQQQQQKYAAAFGACFYCCWSILLLMQ